MTDDVVSARCLQMCSTQEIHTRERQWLIHPLESFHDCRRLKAKERRPDPAKMVKAYRRPAAGTNHLDAAQLRPFGVLLDTVKYLVKLSESSDSEWALVYGFVSDRLRAVRQDMIIERLPPDQTCKLLEPMLSFYFVADYRCRSAGCSSFDPKLHSSQMEECLSRWKTALDAKEDDSETKAQIETKLLYLIYRALEADVILDVYKWRDSIMLHERGTWCLQLISCIRSGNFVRFVRLLRSSDWRLAKTVAWRHLPQMRLDALNVISVAYKSKNGWVSTDSVQNWLGFDSGQDVELCCADFGLTASDGRVSLAVQNKNTPHDLSQYCWNRCDKLLLSSRTDQN